MSKHLQQINITVHLINTTTVLYSYIDPNTHKPVKTIECKLELDRPTCCLFLLDAESIDSGWTMTHIFPNKTDAIPYEVGPYQLSIGTYFEDAKNSRDYKFFIVYYNVHTKETRFIDPQEVNIPPVDCPPK